MLLINIGFCAGWLLFLWWIRSRANTRQRQAWSVVWSPLAWRAVGTIVMVLLIALIGLGVLR